MFRVGICDDSQMDRNTIKGICNGYLTKHGINHEFLEFSNGEELLSFCESNKKQQIHLLFLDIEMGKTSGIKVKEYLLQEPNVKRIIFVTNHGEKMPVAFGFKVVAFIQKTDFENEVEVYLKAMIWEWQCNIRMPYEGLYGKKSVELENVQYLKAVKDYTYIYMAESVEPIWTKYSLKWWEDKLTEKLFVRTHRSYIVNLRHIIKLNSKVFIRGKSEAIPIGKKYQDNVREAYWEFVEGRGVNI